MTTIVRYGNHLISDSRYLNLRGVSVITHEGPAKFFKHPTGKGIIGISGGISNYHVWKSIEADFSQALIDLDNYPEQMPNFDNILRLISNSGDETSVIQRGDAGVPHILIATKDWTVTILIDSDSNKKIKPVIGIYSAKELVAIGSGADFVSIQLTKINSKRSLIEAMTIAGRGDPLTGGKLFYTELKWEEEK